MPSILSKENIKKSKRLDLFVCEKGLAESRTKARAIIMAGNVYVDGERTDKPGTLVNNNSKIEIKSNKPKYVSRGGLKLEKGLEHFNIDALGKICLDIGASTGGFTDCLLKKGALKVYAFDVGHGQLNWDLRNDSRVVVKEKINCRYLEKSDVGELVDIITIDVSFISLTLIIEPAMKVLKEKGELIALIKPQFEVGKNEVGKGGVVKDSKLHEKVKDKIANHLNKVGFQVVGITESPILGADGNKEFLIYARISK